MADEVKDTKETTVEDENTGKEVKVSNTDKGAVSSERDDYSYLTRTGRDMRRLLQEFPFSASSLFDSFFGSDLLNNNMQANEDDKNVVFSFNVAGVDKEDITVGIEHGVLTVEARNDNHAYSYSRSLDEDSVDTDKVNAKYDKGIVEVTIPKIEKVRKVITIE